MPKDQLKKLELLARKESESNPSEEANTIQEVIELLRSVDIDAPDAELNATSISDNNGGRILL